MGDSHAIYWRCAGCGATNEDPHDRECEAWTPEEDLGSRLESFEHGVEDWQFLFARDMDGTKGES